MSADLYSDVVVPEPLAAGAASVSHVRTRPRWKRSHSVNRLTPGQLFAVLLAIALISIPTIWMVFASFKSRDEMYKLPLQIFPSSASTTNYERAMKQVPFPRLFLNSIATTLLSTVAKVLLGVSTAYALVFLKFPGRRLAFWFVVGSLMVPFEVVLIPNYVTVANLGWLNTWAGIIVPGLGVAFGAFLLHQSFRSLPGEIIEAARLDGVGPVKMLTTIVAPMSQPAIAAFALITAVAKWNEYLWPRLVSTREVAATLPVGLTMLRDSEGVNEWGPIMAGAVLVALPVIPLLLVAHRRLVDGLTGGVKG